jgi:outer membrane protein TolC
MSMVAVEPVQTRDGPIDWQAKLTQRFPWFGILDAKEKRQLANAGQAYARYHRKRNAIRKKVKEQFAEYRYLNHATGVVDDMTDYLSRMEQSVREAYESGEAPVHDLLRLENQYEEIRTRVQDLLDRKRAVRADLNQLVDRPTSAPLGEPVESSPDVAELDEDRLRKALLEHRPGIDEARFRERAARENIRLANLSFYPDFSAGVTYSGVGDTDQPGTVDAGSNAYGVLFTLDLPLWQGQRRARVRAARARRRSARMQYEDERSQGYAQLTGALAKLREQERRIDLYRDILLPNAERSLSSAREEYESGDMDIVSFLDFQNRLLMSRLDLYRARAKRRKTVAELEMIIGIPLNRLREDN